MTRTISDHALINWMHRQRLHLATAACIVLIINFGLIPFDFATGWRSTSHPDNWLGLGLDQSSLLDTLSNIFLFIPLGLMLQVSLTRARVRPLLALTGAAVAGGLLSLAIETLQVFSVTRISSRVDLFANILGAGLGAMFGIVGQTLLRQIRRGLRSELKRDPSAVVVKIYIWLLIVFSLTPFVMVPSGHQAARALEHATLVPFQQVGDLADRVELARTGRDARLEYSLRRDTMLLWAGWVAEAVAFGLAGFLSYRHLRTSYQFGARASAALTISLLAGLAAIISVLQLPILTRGFHVTDIVMRAGGATLGVLVGRYGIRRRSSSGDRRSAKMENQAPILFAMSGPSSVRRFVYPALVVLVTYVLFTGLAPFVLRRQPGAVLSALRSDSFLPFFSYFWNSRVDVASADFFSKCLQYGVLAIALGMALRLQSTAASLRSHLFRVVWRCVVLSAAIETAQIFIRSRVPSLTDLIVAGGASFAGVVAYQYSMDYYVASRADHDARVSTKGRLQYGITDALIGTLTEPQGAPENPTTPVHKSRSTT
ncbi:MAG: VanZ family protein [Planctomycetes bacterium]|nr:VanZ family protein [Planctomycetota bacterium]